MLRDILVGNEGKTLMLIDDSTSNCTWSLWRYLLMNMSNKYTKIHFVIYETNLQQLHNDVDDLLHTSHCDVTIHDYVSDPMGWENSDSQSAHRIGTELTNEALITSEEAFLTMIDSLDSLLTHKGYSYTCKVLHRLSQNPDSKMVSVIHSGQHNSNDIKMVQHMATSVVNVTQHIGSLQLHCALKHRKLSGKIIMDKQAVTISKEGNIQFENIESAAAVGHDMEEDVVDPAANLTFNLTLNESEKEARRELVLPYLKTSSDNPSEAQIFYEPDDADDFDDEDPDDDLDI